MQQRGLPTLRSIKHNQSKGYDIDEESLIETILEAKTVAEFDFFEHRWWNEFTRIVEIDGMFIGYTWVKTTGDNTAFEMGWEFDPETIFEAEEYEETVKKYRAKESE